MLWFPYLFPFFFAGMFVAVLYVIAQKGWALLAAQYRYDEVFEGTRIGTVSASINSMNYNNSLRILADHRGLYMRPVFLFRLFHPPLLIPWNDIHYMREKKVLFSKLVELTIGKPSVATMSFQKATAEKLRQAAPGGALIHNVGKLR